MEVRKYVIVVEETAMEGGGRLIRQLGRRLPLR